MEDCMKNNLLIQNKGTEIRRENFGDKPINGIEKLPTGIQGFDKLLEGGIPKGRAITIYGNTGTGKTVFLNEFLYKGISQFNQNGVFVTFEESPKDIQMNVMNFGWDYKRLIENNNLLFIDVSPETEEYSIEIGSDYSLKPLINRINYAIDSIQAKRVAIDGLDNLFLKFNNKIVIRNTICELSNQLKKKHVTSMFSSEKISNELGRSMYGLQEYISDGVIELDLIQGQQQMIRQLNVRKLRGVGYRSGIVEFDINKNGVEVFPKIPIDYNFVKTDFKKRVSFGIQLLDQYTNGGIPEGHIVLISGNTGTGKTLFGLQYLMNGLKNGQPAIWVGLEEPFIQVKKTALEHDWDIDTFEQGNIFEFVGVDSLIDIKTDKLLVDIINAVERINAKRVVIDSISSLESQALNKDKVRQFMIQLAGYFKTRGVTCLMNYLLSSLNFSFNNKQFDGLMETNALRLSSITDGVIMMQYAKNEESIEKYMTIIKLRGSYHKKEIIPYSIKKGGIFIEPQ